PARKAAVAETAPSRLRHYAKRRRLRRFDPGSAQVTSAPVAGEGRIKGRYSPSNSGGSIMVATFQQDGIQFRYPETWRLEREENEEGWTVSVQSPDTAFLMICYRDDQPDPGDVAATALTALKEEYDELEADDCVD